MRDQHKICVVIPALNEARAIGRVLDDIPGWVDEIVVADNGSTDDTPKVAAEHGARVVHEPKRGYGAACLAGLAALGAGSEACDIIVFIDGDYSDHPEEMDQIVEPILRDSADLVIGSRVRGNLSPGALTPQQIFGNWLACRLMALFWKAEFTDLGPFRAIRATSLEEIGMADQNYGWTVEMQIKALRHGLRCTEIPVSYRARIGVSKVSGTLKGTILAGYTILRVIGQSAWNSRKNRL